VLCDDTLSSTRIFDGRLTYQKAAYLLRMLRWKLGDAGFFNGIKAYLNDPALKGKSAKTPQLIDHFEAASGQNLSGFFNQWYYQQGYPSYKIIWDQSGSVLTATVNQTQSHASVPFFEMPIPIQFKSLNKDTTIIFNHSFSGQVFSRSINFKVSQAEFDPELRLLSYNNKINSVCDFLIPKAEIKLYPNPAGSFITIAVIPMGTEVENIQIVDARGNILNNPIKQFFVSQPITVNIETLNPGIYQMVIKTNLGTSSSKFAKE
jgi:hypothetical protein